MCNCGFEIHTIFRKCPYVCVRVHECGPILTRQGSFFSILLTQLLGSISYFCQNLFFFCFTVIFRFLRVKRPHEHKITFSFMYRTLFFDMTCKKLNFGHTFWLECVQNWALRTECEKNYFVDRERNEVKLALSL